MKTSSTTEIITETHRVLTIKRGSQYYLAWCAECGSGVRMVTANEASILARVSSRAIYQLIEARELHFVETPDGAVSICINSLCDLSQNRRRDRFEPDLSRHIQS